MDRGEEFDMIALMTSWLSRVLLSVPSKLNLKQVVGTLVTGLALDMACAETPSLTTAQGRHAAEGPQERAGPVARGPVELGCRQGGRDATGCSRENLAKLAVR